MTFYSYRETMLNIKEFIHRDLLPINLHPERASGCNATFSLIIFPSVPVWLHYLTEFLSDFLRIQVQSGQNAAAHIQGIYCLRKMIIKTERG